MKKENLRAEFEKSILKIQPDIESWDQCLIWWYDLMKKYEWIVFSKGEKVAIYKEAEVIAEQEIIFRKSENKKRTGSSFMKIPTVDELTLIIGKKIIMFRKIIQHENLAEYIAMKNIKIDINEVKP